MVNTPYLREKLSILLTLSPVILLLLLTTSSPLLLFNLLQPIQASESTSASLHTTAPADGTACPSSTVAKLVFDAQGTYSSPYRQFTITNGAFQIYSDAGGNFSMLYTGHINGAAFIPTTSGWSLELNGALEGVYNNTTCVPRGSYQIQIVTPCGSAAPITINLENKPHLGDFNGRVACDPPPPQSMAAAGTTTQDGDRDGIPDANDNCPNLPNINCYKEDTTAIVVHSNTTQSSLTGTTTQDGDRDGIPDANDNCPNLPNINCYKEDTTAIVVHSNR